MTTSSVALLSSANNQRALGAPTFGGTATCNGNFCHKGARRLPTLQWPQASAAPWSRDGVNVHYTDKSVPRAVGMKLVYRVGAGC